MSYTNHDAEFDLTTAIEDAVEKADHVELKRLAKIVYETDEVEGNRLLQIAIKMANEDTNY